MRNCNACLNRCVGIIRCTDVFIHVYACLYSYLLRAGGSGYRSQPVPLAERSKAKVYGRSLAGVAGSNPAGSWMLVLYSKDKRQKKKQDIQDKQLRIKHKERTDNKFKKSSEVENFHTRQNWPWSQPSLLYVE